MRDNIWCHFSISPLSVRESKRFRTEKLSSPINFWQKLLALMKDCWCIESAAQARVMINCQHLLAGSAVQSKIYRRTFISNKYCNETPPPQSLLSNLLNCRHIFHVLTWCMTNQSSHLKCLKITHIFMTVWSI